MPSVWVAVVLVLWITVTFIVVALCRSVRAIDAQLGRGRQGPRFVRKREPQTGAGVEVE